MAPKNQNVVALRKVVVAAQKGIAVATPVDVDVQAYKTARSALLAALEWLKERRPIASPHPAYMDELVEWEVAWRKRPSLDSERYSDNRYSRAEDLKLLLTPRSARAEAKEEDVWRPSAPPPGQRREWKE